MKIADASDHVLKTALAEATKFLLLPALATLGTVVAGQWRFIRVMSTEEILLWSSAISLLSLAAGDAWRRIRSRRSSSATAAGSVPAPTTSLVTEPAEMLTSTARDKVAVGDWMPEIATVEHGGVVWTTLMSPVPSWAAGQQYIAPVSDLSVSPTPTCAKCSTDIMIRRLNARTDFEIYCVGCGWSQPVFQSLGRLAEEATAKMRGVYRQLLASRNLS